MRRAVVAVVLLLATAPAWADEPVIWACECDGGSCPGFKVRFDGQSQAQIAPLDVPHGWSRWRDAESSKKYLVVNTYYSQPDLGCLTINRETGRFHAVQEEINSFEAVAWTHDGVCRPMSPASLEQSGSNKAK